MAKVRARKATAEQVRKHLEAGGRVKSLGAIRGKAFYYWMDSEGMITCSENPEAERGFRAAIQSIDSFLEDIEHLRIVRRAKA